MLAVAGRAHDGEIPGTLFHRGLDAGGCTVQTLGVWRATGVKSGGIVAGDRRRPARS